jgi:hypothetical protein
MRSMMSMMMDESVVVLIFYYTIIIFHFSLTTNQKKNYTKQNQIRTRKSVTFAPTLAKHFQGQPTK